ncbi:MAG: Retinol dehydrogenase [Rhodoglobus sp.]|nr:Retinol dehydrogenase [Rhodoglobus sp.]
MTARSVLVTGASTGIGRATAELLHERGFRVFAGVRKESDAESLRAAGIRPLILDVTNEKHIAAAANAIADDSGGLFGLVNNAGIASAAPLEFVPVDELRHQLEVNVVGQVAVTQAVLPLLRASRGRIVNVTSIGGLIAGQMLGPYNASKFALEAVTHVLRQELGPWGIEVVAIEPGVIATPIWSTSAASADRMLAPRLAEVTALYGAQIEAAQKMAANGTKHGIAPLEVAKAIEKALTARKPKTRYPVGADAKIGAALLARLPDRTRDRLLGGRRQNRAAE